MINEWAKTVDDDGFALYPAGNNSTYSFDKLLGGLIDAYEYADFKAALPLAKKITEWASRVFSRDIKWDGDQDKALVEANMIEWYTLPENLYRAYYFSGEAVFKEFADVWEYKFLWDQPWMSLWMPEKNGNQLACDFSWVISNDHFKEFFVDELLAEANWSDYATYHLDGSMCIKNHLETLLGIEKIKATEFTPGAGSQPASYAEYLPAYKRIQQKGKQLILVTEPQEIDILTSNLSPRGLFIITRTDTEEEANRLIDIAAKMGEIHDQKKKSHRSFTYRYKRVNESEFEKSVTK